MSSVGLPILSNLCLVTVAAEIFRACQELNLAEGNLAENLKAMDEIESNTLGVLPQSLSIALERLLLKTEYEKVYTSGYYTFCLRNIRSLRCRSLVLEFDKINDAAVLHHLMSEDLPQITSFTLDFNCRNEKEVDQCTLNMIPSGFKNLKNFTLDVSGEYNIEQKLWNELWSRLNYHLEKAKKENRSLPSIKIRAWKGVSEEIFQQFLNSISSMDSLRNLNLRMPLTPNQMLQLYETCSTFLKRGKFPYGDYYWNWALKCLYEKNIVLIEMEKTVVHVDSIQDIVDCFRIIATTCPNLVSLTIIIDTFGPREGLFECILQNISQFKCLRRLTMKCSYLCYRKTLLPNSFRDKKIRYLGLSGFDSEINTILSTFENLEVLHADQHTEIDFANMQRPLKYIIYEPFWVSNGVLVTIVRKVQRAYLQCRVEVATWGSEHGIIMNMGKSSKFRPSIERSFPVTCRLTNLEQRCFDETGDLDQSKLPAIKFFQYSQMLYYLIRKICQYDLPFDIGSFEEPSEYIGSYLDLRESKNMSLPDPHPLYKFSNCFKYKRVFAC